MINRLKPYHGAILLAIVLIVLVGVAYIMPSDAGLWTILLNEVVILSLTLGMAKLTKASFSFTFPISFPPVRQFFAGLSIYAGAYLLMIPVVLIIETIFPEFSEVGDYIAEIGTSGSPAVAVLIVAILPAICEETLHRGFILTSLKPLKNPALIVLLGGVAFGIFHLDPYRFLPTAILGAAFTFIALKTDSLILPMIYHFINNLMSVIAMFMSEGYEGTESAVKISLSANIGVGLVYLGVAAVFIWLGVRAFMEKKPRFSVSALVVIISALVVIIGFSVITFGSIKMEYSQRVETKMTESYVYRDEVRLDEDGYYYLTFTSASDNAYYSFALKNGDEIVYSCEGEKYLSEMQTLQLGEGKYTVEVYASSESSDQTEVLFVITLVKVM